MHTLYRHLVTFLCRSAVNHPFRWIVLVALLSLLAAQQVRQIDIDTNMIRLLPRTSRAAVLTRNLENVISDGGYFTLLAAGDDSENLLEAIETAAREISALEEVQSAEYTWPAEFIEEYRYLLIPNDYLERIYEEAIRWEAKANPFVDDLLEAGEQEETFADREDKGDLKLSLARYTRLKRYHESDDGKVMGVLVRTFRGATSIGVIREVYHRLTALAAEIETRYQVRTAVAGSHRNKIDDYSLINSDLSRAGLVAAVLISLLLFLSFRSVGTVAVVLVPLFAGLSWAFALVPATVGDFNVITAFLLIIMFGMGVDYSIHLVKRFLRERSAASVEDALVKTYLSTGSSVVVSGVTTGLSLSFLAVSDFRGFFEFGIIGALSIGMILAAMFLVLPATLVLAGRFHILSAVSGHRISPLMYRTPLTVILSCLLAGALLMVYLFLAFDYNFRNLQYDRSSIPGLREAREMMVKIYPRSLSPGAIYLTADFSSLDLLALLLEESKKKPGTTLGRVRSLRDFTPAEDELAERYLLLADIREQFSGRWTDRIEDADQKKLIEDFMKWRVPEAPPSLEQIPAAVRRAFQAKDGSGRFLVSIHPAVDRKDGRNTMAFAAELYGIENPEGVIGPVGETIVMAEIYWIVTGEAFWLGWLTLGGVFLIILYHRRSVRDALWIVLPLAAGVVLALGAMAAIGMQLNFFNVLVIPALLGMGVDGGVHYYRRWRELGGDTKETQRELFDPLSVANWTTMIGYAGMIIAQHPGLRSLGIFACLGLFCVWLTTLFLMPGLLALRERRMRLPAG